MQVNKEDVNMSVGLAYKMHMHRLNKSIDDGLQDLDIKYWWRCIEKDAIQMIRSSANVMRELEKGEEE